MELEVADLDQWKRRFGPDFGQIKWIEWEGFGLGIAHDLNVKGPSRIVACLDACKEITLIALAILADQIFRLGVRQVFDALLRSEMKLYPAALVVGVDEAIRVAAEAMHVPKAARDAAVAHYDGDLMQGLGQQSPEVPIVVGAAHTGSRVAFDGMIEVGKAQRIAKKEHRRIVAYHIPVALLGIELQGKAADVAFGIRRTALACYGREACEHGGLLADLRKDLRFRIAADVMRDGEGSMGSGALGVHAPFGDHFAIEVRELLDQPDILQQCRAARARRLDIEIVADRLARCMSQVWHGEILFHR